MLQKPFAILLIGAFTTFSLYSQTGSRSASLSCNIVKKSSSAKLEGAVNIVKGTSSAKLEEPVNIVKGRKEARIDLPLILAKKPAIPTKQEKKLYSDVDDAPECGRKKDSLIAVIIANENYQNDVKVDYAHNDGIVFKNYCIKTLGIPENHIRLIKDATYNNIRMSLSWVKKAASTFNGESSIIFYYSGHGIPDEGTKSAYLLPVDGEGKSPRETGYSLDELYRELAECKTKSTLVLMDACFSGASKDGGMLVASRGCAYAPNPTDAYGNLVILSAANGAQTAYKYDAAGHGMFTYFLLKSIKEADGDICLGELSDAVIQNVKQTSIFENDKIQTPTIMTGSSVASDWRNQKL